MMNRSADRSSLSRGTDNDTYSDPQRALPDLRFRTGLADWTGDGPGLCSAEHRESLFHDWHRLFAYFFRGIKQEREGFVAQPFADINFNVYADDDGAGLNGVTFTLGQWNSLHTGPSGSGRSSDDPRPGNVRAWYESDFFTGFTLAIDNWEAGITYTSELSPNDSFGTVQEISFGLAMDDTSLLGSFSLQPHVLMAVEMNGQADGGDGEGVYLEFGVEPGTDVLGESVGLTFPVTIGLSLSNYYENGLDTSIPGGFSDTFGFLDVAAVVAVALPISENYGSWELTGGLHLFTLGSYLEAWNENDGVQVVGTLGFGIGS